MSTSTAPRSVPNFIRVSDHSQDHGWWLASDGKWYPPESHRGYRHRPSPKQAGAYVGIGVALGILVGAVLMVSLRDDPDSGPVLDKPSISTSVSDDDVLVPGDILVPEPRPLPTATLTVFSDGCGVIRSELRDEPYGLTWSIVDADGFQVLARNAAGETRYRYFQSGTYTVVLKAWDGSKYAAISNTVTIHC
jgi:hypothetical protein